MNTQPVFYKQVLSNGDVVHVHELTGDDYFNACIKAGQNMNAIAFYLAQECCTLNGKRISIAYLKCLSFSDCQKLLDVVATQISSV